MRSDANDFRFLGISPERCQKWIFGALWGGRQSWELNNLLLEWPLCQVSTFCSWVDLRGSRWSSCITRCRVVAQTNSNQIQPCSNHSNRFTYRRSSNLMWKYLIHKLGFNQNYCTFALILLIKIVLCIKFHWTKFQNYKCFHMKGIHMAQGLGTWLLRKAAPDAQITVL